MNDVVKVDKATATKEFERLCESWKIKIKSDDSGSKESIIDAILDGAVEIHDKGDGWKLNIIQHLDVPLGDDYASIKYKFPTAGDMMQMDKFKENETFRRSGAMVASVTGVAPALVSKMGGPDFLLAQAIAFVFLGV